MTVDRRVKTYQSDLSLERENLGLLGLKSDLFHILRRNYTGTGHEKNINCSCSFQCVFCLGVYYILGIIMKT